MKDTVSVESEIGEGTTLKLLARMIIIIDLKKFLATVFLVQKKTSQ